MKSLLDPGFKYEPSHDTDIRRRFERMKRERAARGRQDEANRIEALAKVEKLVTRKAK